MEPADSAAGSTWQAKRAAVRRVIREPDRALVRFDLGVAALLARCRGLWYMSTARAYGVDVPTCTSRTRRLIIRRPGLRGHGTRIVTSGVKIPLIEAVA